MKSVLTAQYVKCMYLFVDTCCHLKVNMYTIMYRITNCKYVIYVMINMIILIFVFVLILNWQFTVLLKPRPYGYIGCSNKLLQ